MGISWTLRKYQDGDEQAIFELLNTAFGKWHSLKYWHWKYKENLAGSPIVWLAEYNKKIIGHYAIMPITMKVGNAYMTGSFSCDAATDPAYQGKGVLSSLLNRCYLDAAENDIPITYGFPNISLGPTYKRYERLGHICFFTRMINVLNWKPILNKYIHNKLLASAGAYVLGKMRRSQSTDWRFKIERVSRFDERINAFWEEISQHFTIIVKRDQRYLNWRYADHPEREYTIYTAAKDDRIVGYCVLSELALENLRIGVIVDIVGLQGNPNAVRALIQSASLIFRQHDVDAVSCMISEGHPYEKVLKRAGFIPHPRHLRALYATVNLRGSTIDEKKAYTQALILSQNSLFKKKSNWFMMSGDGDQDY